MIAGHGKDTKIWMEHMDKKEKIPSRINSRNLVTIKQESNSTYTRVYNIYRQKCKNPSLTHVEMEPPAQGDSKRKKNC